jgi:hypothetical protein
MRLGTHSFLLQNYYVEDWAANFVMHVLVENLQDWWAHIASLDLASRYGVASPRPPKLEPWDSWSPTSSIRRELCGISLNCRQAGQDARRRRQAVRFTVPPRGRRRLCPAGAYRTR